MENDDYKTGLNILEQNAPNLENAFKIDYDNQKLDGNAEFENWKSVNIKKYGNDYRLFKCSLDKLIFITTKKDCVNYPFYQSLCPKCQKNICYFCSRYAHDSFGNGNCCIRRRICCMIFQEGFRYINPYKETYIPDFKESFKKFIIPVFNFLYFTSEIQCAFFYKLTTNNAEIRESGYLENYEGYIQRNYYFILQLVVGINAAFAIILSLSYILFNIYFIIFMLVISLPFKFYPLKYIIGIGYRA